MLPASTIQQASPFTARDRLFLGLLVAAASAVGLRGIYHYGYIGQDFLVHLRLITAFPTLPWTVLYYQTTPPALYWLGSLVREHAPAHFLEALALVFLVLNAAGLWIFYGFLWNSMVNWQLRYSAAAFATFVPFRLIHSIVIAADAFSLPLFALAALFALRLFGRPGSFGSWVGLSLSLSAGVLCKYTFAGMLPAAAILLAAAVRWRLPSGERLRWSVVGILALAVPSEVFALEMVESSRAKGTLTDLVWLRKGEPAVMRWRDILLLKENDLGLLSAPEYFRDRVYEVRKYSYLGLLHVSSVTDVMNLFQPPPGAIPTDWGQRAQRPFLRDRTARSQRLQVWSVRWCLAYSAMAVLGTLSCGALSAGSLLRRVPILPDATVVITVLAVGFICPVFLTLTLVNDPYMAAYWYPRLVLPAILVFYSLGFVALDRLCQRLARRQGAPRRFLLAFAGYTLVACLLFIGFLY
ncbi:MAG: hypothetical protein ABSH26_03095 [Opitutaceae bacterium]|jgi:hypothetical protein